MTSEASAFNSWRGMLLTTSGLISSVSWSSSELTSSATGLPAFRLRPMHWTGRSDRMRAAPEALPASPLRGATAARCRRYHQRSCQKWRGVALWLRACNFLPRGEGIESKQPNRSHDHATCLPAHSYGEADFRRIRRNRWLYVDKTPFLRRLEEERYAFLIRPRRFGKSLWVSLLESYYDRFWADGFDATFARTDVGQDPNGEQSRYVTLRFNFSLVNDKLETLQREFETYCMIELRGTLRRHPDLFPEAAMRDILAPPPIATKLSVLFRYAGDHDIPRYVLIDEYDNFATRCSPTAEPQAYYDFIHAGGFYRSFFAILKGGADRSGGGLERLFITGVSPITMDDVTSGFNIGANISREPDFNEMVGFTEAEVRRLVETYRELGVFNQEVATAMGIMVHWCNGYRFATTADTDLYNTDRCSTT